MRQRRHTELAARVARAAPWVLVAVAAAGTGMRDGAPSASAASQQSIVLTVGDEVRVAGSQIGCRVTTRAGRAFLDCRRAGELRGTYGTLLGERRAMLVLFRSGDVAEVIASGRHHGGVRVCPRRAVAARASCRP